MPGWSRFRRVEEQRDSIDNVSEGTAIPQTGEWRRVWAKGAVRGYVL